MEKIFVTRTSLPPFEEYCAEIRELWDSALITNMGVKHQQLQRFPGRDGAETRKILHKLLRFRTESIQF